MKIYNEQLKGVSSGSALIDNSQNLGAGIGICSNPAGSTLQFKSLVAGNNITLSSSSTEITINSTASGSGGADSVTVENIQQGSLTYGIATGSVNTYLVTANPAYTQYSTGSIINFIANTTATGSSVLNINSLGNKVLKKFYNTNIENEDIITGQVVSALYDGLNFQIISPIRNKLYANKTINFNNTMTATQMQAAIRAVPRDLNGYSLIVQFADGNYNLSTQIIFDNFMIGNIFIRGNTGESITTLHTNQAVVLTSATSTCINVVDCSGTVDIHNMKMISKTAGTMSYVVSLTRNTCTRVKGCYVVGSGATYSDGGGVLSEQSNDIVQACYFTSGYSAITAGLGARVCSFGNDDIGTQPNYGLMAQYGGVIAKAGNQPAGTSADYTDTGGEIR